jgi:hypothetical protein
MSREIAKAVKGSTSAVKTLADALDRARPVRASRVEGEYRKA